MNPVMEFPEDFRCPISMELMKEPVTISTGVTYERKNIERWFHTYKKNTCPATMQSIGDTLEITPNHTLKRLIQSWQLENNHDKSKTSPSSSSSSRHEELVCLLKTIESSPFKVSSLKKLRSLLVAGNDNELVKFDFKKSGGVEVMVKIIVQILDESWDFSTFRNCEEALGIMNQIPLSEEDEECVQMLMKPECIKSFAIMLQRGSAEARFCTVSLIHKTGKADYHLNHVMNDQGIDFFKSLFEMVSDEICTKASSCALQVLIAILDASKKSRLKAIQAGGVCTLIEILLDANNKSKCERIMQLIKLMCECADGRLAFIEHGLGIPAVSKRMLNVSSAATKIGVKILWLICSSHPTEKVLEEMLVFGSLKKLVALLHISGASSTKDRVIKIFKLHADSWKRFPCFPRELKDYLGLHSDF